MKQLVILSGKGGTGKTTVAAGLAHLAHQTLDIVLADADVDAANLGLVLAPVDVETHPHRRTHRRDRPGGMCIGCGECAEVCRFDAVIQAGDVFAVDDIA